jgi:hypothetical protein
MTNSDFLAKKIAEITKMDIEISKQIASTISQKQIIRAICEEPIQYKKQKDKLKEIEYELQF